MKADKKMTREQAKKLIETYCVDAPSAGAEERLLDIDIGYPNVQEFAEDLVPKHFVILERTNGTAIAIPQTDLDTVLYNTDGERA